jgi:hypothetical protein
MGNKKESSLNKLHVGAPQHIAEFTIIPIERITLSAHTLHQSVWLYGSKEIAALVIHTPHSLLAFDINGQELSIDKLVCEAPDLKEFLAGHNQQ